MPSQPHNGKANSGPVDFLHLLKRRRVSFERWAEHEGILTQEAFASWKEALEVKGEFYASEELLGLGRTLPVAEVPVVTAEEPTPEPSDAPEDLELGPPSPKGRKRIKSV